MIFDSGIRVGQLILNSVDANGFRWIVEDIDGWWNLPESAVPSSPLSAIEDGSSLVAGRYLSRKIEITGRALSPVAPPNQAVLAETQRSFHRNLNAVRSTLVMQVDEYDVSKQATVQIDGRPRTWFDAPSNSMKFSITLRAADPRKYESEPTTIATRVFDIKTGRSYNRTYNRTYPAGSSFDGIMTASNVGSTNTYGLIRLRGPINLPQVELLETGQTLKFDIHLTSAAMYLDIDLETRTVKLDGIANRRNLLTSDSEWFTLAPGVNSIKYSAGAVGGTTAAIAELMYRSAWLE